MRNFGWKLATILSIAFALRVAYVDQARRTDPYFSNPGSDARYYVQLARAMNEGTAMGNPKPKTVPTGAKLEQCRSPKCRRWIFWIQVDGQSIPLDPVRVGTYFPPEGGTDGNADEFGEVAPAGWAKGPLGYLSHFKTCPDADKFSGGGTP